jgi:hypothetical protein
MRRARFQIINVAIRVPVPARAAVQRRAEKLGVEVAFWTEKTTILGPELTIQRLLQRDYRKELGL